MSDEKPSVVEALSAVMADVQAVAKKDRNTDQNFNFRGIDAVVNAVGPAMRTHGVVAVPTNVQSVFEGYESKRGAKMRNATLTITWRFYGPKGDFIEAQTMGEAADSSDKSVSKAHSVAYRTLLLQALCIPTDEADADASVHERAAAPPPDPRIAVQREIRRMGEAQSLTPKEIQDDFVAWSAGVTIIEADLDLLEKYRAHMRDKPSHGPGAA